MELETARNLLAFPLQDEGAELSRRMFLFSVFTDLAFVDLRGLRASQIETNSEGKRYIRKAKHSFTGIAEMLSNVYICPVLMLFGNRSAICVM